MKTADYLALLRRHTKLVAGIVLAVTLAAMVLAYLKPPVYEATARIRIRPVAGGSDLGELLQNNLRFQTSVPTEAELVKSAPVAEDVLKRVPGAAADAGELLKHLTVIPVNGTDVLNVTVSETDPVAAQNVANAFVDSYIAIRRQQAADEAKDALEWVSKQVKRTEARLAPLEQQVRRMDATGGPAKNPDYVRIKGDRDNVLTQLALQRAQQQALLERSALNLGVADVVERAPYPDGTGPSVPRNAALGFLIGVALAIGAVLLLDSSDTTVKTRSEAETHTEAELLGTVPHDEAWRDPNKARLVTVSDPLSPAAEAYRLLAANVAPHLNGLHRILVTSPGRGEGKTSTAANLAMSFAEAGYRVALVSADFRRPRVHAFFDAPAKPGVTDVLTGQAKLEATIVKPSEHLSVLPTGTIPKQLHRLMRNGSMDALLAALGGSSNGHKNGYKNGHKAAKTATNGNGSAHTNGAPKAKRDGTSNGHHHQQLVVVIDAPAALEGAEASTLGEVVDGTVLVLRAGHTSRADAAEAAEQIRRNGNLVGTVLVGANAPRRSLPSFAPRRATSSNGSSSNGSSAAAATDGFATLDKILR